MRHTQGNPDVASSLQKSNIIYSIISLAALIHHQPLGVLKQSHYFFGADGPVVSNRSSQGIKIESLASRSIVGSHLSLESWANQVSDIIVLILVDSSKKVQHRILITFLDSYHIAFSVGNTNGIW